MATASGRTVFVLGSEAAGNREMVVVEDGATYDLDAATIETYSAGAATFPYVAE